MEETPGRVRQIATKEDRSNFCRYGLPGPIDFSRKFHGICGEPCPSEGVPGPRCERHKDM